MFINYSLSIDNMADITTIQIRENVKNELDKMKARNQTYEEVILDLMRFADESKRRRKELLIEECRVMAKDSIRTTKEWEATDNKIDWEW